MQLMIFFISAKACPAATALEEWRTCNDHPCITFYWEASPWGLCIEDSSMNLNGTGYWNGTATCAVGVQIRKVVCMKMGVGPVIPKRCLIFMYEIYNMWICGFPHTTLKVFAVAFCGG